MKMVVGVVRETCLARILKDLENISIRNVTLAEVKGIGEQITLFKAYAIHKVILIAVSDEKADEVANIIVQSARTGSAGDGMVVVCPVDYMVKIRTTEKIE